MKLPLHALAACLLCACSSVVVNDIPATTTVNLQPRQSAALGSHAALRFDAIVDSRCPANVKCVWAGALNYQMTLSGGKAPETFLLGDNGASHASTQFEGVTVALAPLTPPPVQAAGVPPLAHPITVTITRR